MATKLSYIRLREKCTLKRHLQRKGYYNGPVDGNWNQETWAAIVKFKRANGLKPDGVIDATT
jgi:peptidoglycan hydrolase-like protein with peptidoglycan-binding domain